MVKCVFERETSGIMDGRGFDGRSNAHGIGIVMNIFWLVVDVMLEVEVKFDSAEITQWRK